MTAEKSTSTGSVPWAWPPRAMNDVAAGEPALVDDEIADLTVHLPDRLASDFWVVGALEVAARGRVRPQLEVRHVDVDDALHQAQALGALAGARVVDDRKTQAAVNGEGKGFEDLLDLAAEDLHAGVEVTTDLATTLPLPPEPLRVILRNLLSNAVAAGTRHVHVATVRSLRSWRLLVDDDGVGLGNTDSYDSGSGLGLSLCRRIAARFGGVLELAPRPFGGTRATLVFAQAVQ